MNELDVKTRLDFILSSDLSSYNISLTVNFFLDFFKERIGGPKDEVDLLFLDYTPTNIHQLLYTMEREIRNFGGDIYIDLNIMEK